MIFKTTKANIINSRIQDHNQSVPININLNVQTKKKNRSGYSYIKMRDDKKNKNN